MQILKKAGFLLSNVFAKDYLPFTVVAWATCTVSAYDVTFGAIQTLAFLFTIFTIVTRITWLLAQRAAPTWSAGARPVPRIAFGAISTLTVVAAVRPVFIRWALCKKKYISQISSL